MCNMSNEVPQLFDWNQENNQPADRWSRLELNYSCVEFVAGVEYMVSRVVFCIMAKQISLTNYLFAPSLCSLGLHNRLYISSYWTCRMRLHNLVRFLAYPHDL